MSRLGLSLPSTALLRGRARGLLPEVLALTARMTAAPSAGRTRAIGALVQSLKTAGVWPKLDVLYILAAHDAQAARLNWMADLYNLTAVNSPSFLADQGYAGGTNTYLATGYNPAVHGVRYTRNDAHMGVWDLTDRAAGNIVPAGTSTGTGVLVGMLQRYSTDRAAISVNDQSSTFANAHSEGFFIGNRLSSATRGVYRNGVLLVDTAATSVAIPSIPVDLLCFIYNGGAARGYWCTDRIAAFSMGGGLTAGEAAAFHAALRAYLQSVGAVA
ncbi:hypothetical protein [Aquabacter cavernae]|uniref:hypothetical protein n=1 Tax=Aquabacter cavernae TaxID=2496029 RepID=UPI000F8EAAE6|nr:hypothetical protein [Aquabacter cavernae]